MKYIISFMMRKVPRRHLQLFSHFAVKFISIFYIGNTYECLVCSHSYRKFLPYGVKGRSNALCPNCLSLERHRLMWLFMKGKTNFFTDKLKVLHIAPEYCFIKRFDNMDNLDYVTADLESPLAKVKMDIHDAPFDDNTFDVVFCNHILEHVDDDFKAISELYRVLKPGGWGIILSPINYSRDTTYEDKSITSEKEREKHFGQKDHVREYGKDYLQRLESSGFKSTEDKLEDVLTDEKIKKHSLNTGEPIYFVQK